jgi:hypothetical protein
LIFFSLNNKTGKDIEFEVIKNSSERLIGSTIVVAKCAALLIFNCRSQLQIVFIGVCLMDRQHYASGQRSYGIGHVEEFGVIVLGDRGRGVEAQYSCSLVDSTRNFLVQKKFNQQFLSLFLLKGKTVDQQRPTRGGMDLLGNELKGQVRIRSGQVQENILLYKFGKLWDVVLHQRVSGHGFD